MKQTVSHLLSSISKIPFLAIMVQNYLYNNRRGKLKDYNIVKTVISENRTFQTIALYSAIKCKDV